MEILKHPADLTHFQAVQGNPKTPKMAIAGFVKRPDQNSTIRGRRIEYANIKTMNIGNWLPVIWRELRSYNVEGSEESKLVAALSNSYSAQFYSFSLLTPLRESEWMFSYFYVPLPSGRSII
jgi:hypothetical protein